MSHFPAFSTLAHVSFSVTVRLKTSFCGVESGSTMKVRFVRHPE